MGSFLFMTLEQKKFVVVLSSLFLVFAGASHVYAVETVYEDFESYSNGAAISGLSNDYLSWTGTGSTVSNAAESEGSLGLSKTSSGARATFDTAFGTTSGTVIFSFYTQELDTGGNSFYLENAAFSNICGIAQIGFSSDVQLVTGGGASVESIGSNPGGFYQLELEVDFSANTCRARLNGGTWSSTTAIGTYDTVSHFNFEVSGDIYFDYLVVDDGSAPPPTDYGLYWTLPVGYEIYATSTTPITVTMAVETLESTMNTRVVVREFNDSGLFGDTILDEQTQYAPNSSTTQSIVLTPTASTTYKIQAYLEPIGFNFEDFREIALQVDYVPDDLSGETSYRTRYGTDGTGTVAQRTSLGCGNAVCSVSDLSGCVKVAMCWAFVPDDSVLADWDIMATNIFSQRFPFAYVAEIFGSTASMPGEYSFFEWDVAATSTVSTTTSPTYNVVLPMSLGPGDLPDLTILDFDDLVTASTTAAEGIFQTPLNYIMGFAAAIYIFFLVGRLIRLIS